MEEKLLFEIITTFCELPSGPRDAFRVPYDDGEGNICATDGTLIIAVPKSLMPKKGSFPARPELAPSKITFAPSDKFDIPIKDLFKRLKRHLETENCPECKGKGKVTWVYFCNEGHDSYDRKDDCPVCGGTGKLNSNPHSIVPGADRPVSSLAAFRIKHGGTRALFFAQRLAIVANAANMLGETELHVVGFSETGCMKVALPEGIFAGVMPCVNQVPVECIDL